MKIYFVRHGQTDLNINTEKHIKRMQGQSNFPLNETGINQAKVVREKLNPDKIDFIICSPLKRAQETASIINEKLNKKIIIDDRLIEMNFGSLEGTPVKEEYWIYGFDYTRYGGESLDKFKDRIFKFLDDIREKYKYKNVLIVAHGGVSRMFNLYFNGMPKDNNLFNLGMNNCEIKEYFL